MSQEDETTGRMIITAASNSYADALLAWLGSLNLNWPGHPPVRVYDIGLTDATQDVLHQYGIDVVKVPPFCPHWRKHFTWKLWCWNDVPASEFLYMDAGTVVLSPLDEVFASTTSLGYFVIPTYHGLDENASEAACRGCSVSDDFRNGKVTLSGGVAGFCRKGVIKELLAEALCVAHNEQSIEATRPEHRHDQAILSLLMYRDVEPLILMDGIVYGGWQSPRQTPGQKVWFHRRRMSAEDHRHFITHIFTPGRPYIPKGVLVAPSDAKPQGIREAAYRIYKRFQRRVHGTPASSTIQREKKIYDGIRD
jgi:hypothetical protein